MKLGLPYQSLINPKTKGVRVLKSINMKVTVNFVIAQVARCEVVKWVQVACNKGFQVFFNGQWRVPKSRGETHLRVP
jgi:hypothetical protein